MQCLSPQPGCLPDSREHFVYCFIKPDIAEARSKRHTHKLFSWHQLLHRCMTSWMVAWLSSCHGCYQMNKFATILQNWNMLAWIRNLGIVRVSAAMLNTFGLPADFSFLPYRWDLSCRGQLLGGFRAVQSAPVRQAPALVRSQSRTEGPASSAIHAHARCNKLVINNTSNKTPHVGPVIKSTLCFYSPVYHSCIPRYVTWCDCIRNTQCNVWHMYWESGTIQHEWARLHVFVLHCEECSALSQCHTTVFAHCPKQAGWRTLQHICVRQQHDKHTDIDTITWKTQTFPKRSQAMRLPL